LVDAIEELTYFNKLKIELLVIVCLNTWVSVNPC